MMFSEWKGHKNMSVVHVIIQDGDVSLVADPAFFFELVSARTKISSHQCNTTHIVSWWGVGESKMEGEASRLTGEKRTRSEIGKQWWANKRQKAAQESSELKAAKKEVNRLQKLNDTLSRLNSGLVEEKAELKEAICRANEEKTLAISCAREEKASAICRADEERAYLNAVITREREDNELLKVAIAGVREELARERAKGAAELERLTAENESLSQSIKETAPFVKSLDQYGGFCKLSNKETLLTALGSAIVAILSVVMRKTQPITRLRTICEVLFDRAIYGAAVTAKVLEEMYQKYFFKEHREIFAPWKVLRAIDVSAVGGLNYSGLETLRSCEGLGKYQRGILPSRSSVQRASYDLHQLSQGIIPFHKVHSPLGEMYQYDYERFLRFVLKTFKLDEIAQRESVEVSMTLDGAELCDGISHLTAGVKVTDSRAIDPRDGTPMCFTDDLAFARIFKTQSRNYCFAMKSLIGKDSKKAYEEFRDFFLFFENVKKFGLPESQFGPRIFPIIVKSPQDMSSLWKCLNTGCGARKNGDKHFCHVCACSGNTIVRFLVDENRYSSLAFFLYYASFLIQYLNCFFPFWYCIIDVTFAKRIIGRGATTGVLVTSSL